MTGTWWLDALIAVAAAVLVAWGLLVATLVLVRPGRGLLREALRLLPDVLVLVRQLAADRRVALGVRVRLWLLLGYLALPVDLVPDYVPVLGWVDDVIVVAVVLRSAVRRAGLAALRRHWRGSEDGFAVLCRLTGLSAGAGPGANGAAYREQP